VLELVDAHAVVGGCTPLVSEIPDTPAPTGSQNERMGGGIKLSAAVMTHPLRLDAACDLQRRHPELELEVVLDPVPEHRQRSPLRAARAAWRTAPADATHRLVVQDDVVLCPDFLHHVRCAIAASPAAALSFFAEWGSYTSYGLRLAALSGSSWVEVSDTYLPTQAAVLPTEVAAGFDEFAAREAGRELMDDVVLLAYLRRLGVPALVSVPNLVEHDHVPSLIRYGSYLGPRRSACYAPAVQAPPRWSGGVTAPTLIPVMHHDNHRALSHLRPSPDRHEWSWVRTERLLSDRGLDLGALGAALERALAGTEGGAEAADTIGRPMLDGLWHTSVALGLALRQLWSETGRARPFADALHDPVASVALSSMPAGALQRVLTEDVMARVGAPLTALVRRGLEESFAASATLGSSAPR
jgi:hypothetical protein